MNNSTVTQIIIIKKIDSISIGEFNDSNLSAKFSKFKESLLNQSSESLKQEFAESMLKAVDGFYKTC